MEFADEIGVDEVITLPAEKRLQCPSGECMLSVAQGQLISRHLVAPHAEVSHSQHQPMRAALCVCQHVLLHIPVN